MMKRFVATLFVVAMLPFVLIGGIYYAIKEAVEIGYDAGRDFLNYLFKGFR